MFVCERAAGMVERKGSFGGDGGWARCADVACLNVCARALHSGQPAETCHAERGNVGVEYAVPAGAV